LAERGRMISIISDTLIGRRLAARTLFASE
jgi:hypothetical protein